MKRYGSLNRIYRLVWNEALQTWVAVSEIGRRCKKGVSSSRVARRSALAALGAAATIASITALAAPSGGKVTSGNAQINQSGSTTTIDQLSPNVSINWQSFNVGNQETVNFVQPSANAVAVNRIYSADGTTILGHINANGQIFLIDPNGVLFGAGAQVNVGGLVASTLDVTGSENPNQLSFAQTGSSNGKVINQGTLNAAQGGYIALLGEQASNQGTIGAKLGTVALGGGSAATLTFNGNQLVHFQIDQGTLDSLAENRQLITADGGQVIMTAGAKNSALASVVNNTGIIEARAVDNHDGVITLLAGMQAGTVNVAGTLDASAPNGGNGGAIETSGSVVKVASTAVVTTQAPSGKTGSWLIDPTDYTVAASGGDITGATLSSELATSNVTLQSSAGISGTAGNVNVNDAVNWSSNNTLSLVASNNVNINANVSASGASAGLVITPGASGAFNLGGGASVTLSGAAPSLSIAGVSYTVINSLGVAGDTSGQTLQGMQAGGNYALGSNINASATSTWNAGAGFTPVAAVATLEGLGHTISGLTESTANPAGLLGDVQGQVVVRDLGLVNETITETGNSVAGGLIGASTNQGVTVPELINVYTTGTINGRYGAGGLIGGGGASIEDSFSLDTVSGYRAGGLLGGGGGTIDNSYFGGHLIFTALGQPSAGQQAIGGLVGSAGGPSSSPVLTITNSYADGVITLGTGSTPTGGLLGQNLGTAASILIVNSYWDMTASGQTSSAGGGVGLAGAAALQQASYAGFDFSSPVWSIVSGYNHPLLTAFLKPLTVTASGGTEVYNGSGQTGVLAFSDPNAVGSPHLSIFSDAIDVGTYDPKSAVTFVPDQFGWLVTLNGSGALDITPKTISVSATGVDKVYNGNTGATVTLAGNGLIAGDAVTLSDAAATFADKNVGNGKTISVTGIALSGAKADDYALAGTTATTTADITPKAISVVATGTDKVYDGNTTDAAVLAGIGVIAGDAVTFTDTSSTFANKNVGNGKTVTVSGIALSGADAGNYTVNNSSTTGIANITPATITVSAAGTNRTYDGTTTDAVTLAALGAIAGDMVSATDTGANFADKNAGNGKTVTVSGLSLTGADASNYVLASSSTTTTANIAKAPLSVTGTGVNKVYDATTADPIVVAYAGEVAGDSINLSATGTFSDKNVGNNKAVSISGFQLTGTDAGNYSIVPTSFATVASITPATVTITATGTNKVYDGTTADAVNLAAAGVVAGDSVSATDTSANFADKNVGANKTVSVTGITLTGADAGNYVVASAGNAMTTASITPATVTITATGTNKVYDGSTADMVSLATTGIVAGDSVTATDTGANFVNKNVGMGKTVNVTGITLSGADAANYVVSSAGTAMTTANITPASITVTATGTNKVYDGTTADTVNLATSGVIAGDVVSATDSSATFANKNVGNAKTVTVSGIALSGADAGNYVVASGTNAMTSANITPATVTITATGTNKVYDGTIADAVNLAAAGVVAGDSVAATDTSANFADKNAGTNKIVTVTGITLTGADAGNYVVASAGNAMTTANITPATLTITATGANKVYDGTTVDMVSLATAGIVAGDNVTASDTGAAFANKNVGNAKTVTVSGIGLSGADAGNYVVASGATAMTTANITPASLTVTATGTDKVYNGTTTDLVNLATAGVIAGDSVTATDTSAAFDNKNVGNGKTVTVSGIGLSGADAANYVVASGSSAMTTASITPATVTITATGTNKVYNGTTADAVSLAAAGVVAGDSVSATDASANFADKNVGNNKAVSVTGITLTGADAGNYVVASAGNAMTSASITPATITITATGANKVYDGTTADAVSLATAGVIAGDSVTASDSSANFGDRNVGNAKTVSVAGLALSGADAGNYMLASTSVTTVANITPASLTYVASPASATQGQALPVLTGSVTGFVAGDSLGNSTSGSASWLTSATSSSAPGSYAIDGSGLSATNYVFTQAPGNATALKLAAAQSGNPPPPAPAPAPAPSPSNSLSADSALDIQNATAVANRTCTSASGTTEEGIDSAGCRTAPKPTDPPRPGLHIVNGGVRLPAQLISAR